MSGKRKSARSGRKSTGALIATTLLLLLFFVLTQTGVIGWQEIFEWAGVVPLEETTQTQTAAVPVEGELCLTVLDVGQGDAILIQLENYTALIDAGDTFAQEALLEGLYAHGVEKLDLLVATHPHRDHIGSMCAVLENFPVDRVLFTNVPEDETPTSTTYLELLDTLAEKEIPTFLAGTGEKIEMPQGRMTVLCAGGFSELNDCSLVIRCEYGNVSFLLMGDAEFPVENAMLEDGLAQPCTVLKAGHHGSQYASSQEFLDAVSPQYIAVSCGKDNRYGNPSEEFLERAERTGAEILRTDQLGEISFYTDGTEVRVETTAWREAA